MLAIGKKIVHKTLGNVFPVVVRRERHAGGILMRSMSGQGAHDEAAVKAAIEEINDLFVEARDEIEYAEEEAGTTYFNDTFNDAKNIVNDVLSKFDDLLKSVDEDERGRLQRSMGMKVGDA